MVLENELPGLGLLIIFVQLLILMVLEYAKREFHNTLVDHCVHFRERECSQKLS